MRAVIVVPFVALVAFLVLPASARVPCKNCYKVLSTDIKNAAKKSLTAVVQAGLDLTKMRDTYSAERGSLESNLKMAREMTDVIKKKIQTSVEEMKALLSDVTGKVNKKMDEVKEASEALGELEKKVNTQKVQDKAKKIRDEIAKGQPVKSKVDKDVMNENGVITTLDAAKILAKEKVKKTQEKVEKEKAALKNDITKLENAMSSTESQLDSEEQKEIEDEREARNKIQEAVKHNQAALSKAKQFLLTVEKGIEQFHKDISEVPLS